MHSPDPPNNELAPVPSGGSLLPRQAETDQQLIDLWLHARSRHTQRAYRADAHRLLDVVGKPVHRVSLGDLQGYAEKLVESGLQPSSVHRTMSSVKSLFAFGHRLGYLSFDVAAPLRLPALRDSLT